MVWCQRQLLLPLGPRYCLSSGWVPLWRVWRGSTQPAAFSATDGSVIPRRWRRVENKHTHRITKLFMLHIKYGKCHSFAGIWSVSIYRFPLALVEIDEAINYFIMVTYSSTQILSWRLKCTYSSLCHVFPFVSQILCLRSSKVNSRIWLKILSNL